MMAEEKQQAGSSTIDGQARRDDLIDKLHRGELNPDKAMREASKLGLLPLVGNADPSIFDPVAKAFWTPLMAVAWIVFRDVNRVRWVADEYRMKCTHFKPHKIGQKTTYEIVTYPAANRRTLDIYSARVVADRHSGMTVDEAIQVLTQALSEDAIEATGIRKGETARSPIDSMHWEDLKYFQDEHSDTVGGKANCWHKVRLNRDSIMKLWPERSSESDNSVSVGSALPPKAVRQRGASPGDEEKRAKEIAAIVAAGREERKTSPKASCRAIAACLRDKASVKDTRFKSSDTIAKILSGRYPLMHGIKSPFKTRA
ncbi:MAG: hypothetical protein WA813_15560 [Beijerinckiaceae bacterium]